MAGTVQARPPSALRWAGLLAVSFAVAGCALGREESRGIVETSIRHGGLVRPLAEKDPPAGTLAHRMLAARRTDGWNAGLRVLSRRIDGAADIAAARQLLAAGFREDLRGAVAFLRLPEAVVAAAAAFLDVSGEASRLSAEGVDALLDLRDAVDDFLFDSHDEMERLEALTVLGDARDYASAPLVFRLFEGERCPLVRAACLRALSGLDPGLAEKAVSRGLVDGAPEVRVEALRTVESLRLRRYRPKATELLTSMAEPVSVRRRSARALAAVGTWETIPVLIDALAPMNDDSVRVQAVMALRSITQQSFGMRPAQWRRWWGTMHGKGPK